MKKLQLHLTGIFAFLSVSVFAQFNADWADIYQHTSVDDFSNEARKVVTDTVNGGTYVLFDVTSDLDPNNISTATTWSYCVLRKYDLFGSMIASYQINVGQHSSTGFDRRSGFGLKVDYATGDVYAGYMSYDATTSYDINITKFDSQLNLLWTHKFNAPTEDIGLDMDISSVGTAFAVVRSIFPPSAIRYRIIKASGPSTTTTPYYTYNAQPDYPTSLAVEGATQKIFLTGYRLVGSVKNILISCVSGSAGAGTLLWSRVNNCGSVTGDDVGRNITLGYDGFLYITGSSTGPVSHGIDVVTMKYNPSNGKMMWENYINLNLTDGGFFVLNPDDDFVYVSWTAGNTVYIDQMLAADGFFVRRISYIPYPVSPYNALAGVTVTDMKISKTMRIFLCGSILASNGGQDFSASYLIRATFNGRGAAHVEHSIPVEGDPTQSFRGTAISLDVAEEQVYFIEDQWMSYTNHQQETAILVSFDMPGGFRLQDDNQDAISQATTTTITPNPFSDRIQVRSDQSFNKAEVFDVAGRMVYSLPLLSTEDTNLELKDLTKGFYTLRLSHDNGTTTVQQIVRN